MKLATTFANDPLHEYITEYKKRIEKRTQGRIQATLYPSSELGRAPHILNGVQRGNVEMFVTPVGYLVSVDPRFHALEAPGLFDSPKHARLTAADPQLRAHYLNIGVPRGIRGISLWMYGATAYSSSRPLRKLSDFRGEAFRILAMPIEERLMRQLGADGIPMQYTQTALAFREQHLSGVRGSIIAMSSSGHQDSARYVTPVNDSYIPCVALVSTSFYDSLPLELQTAIDDVGREMDAYMYRVVRSYVSRARSRWRSNGGRIIELSKEDQAEFMRQSAAVADDFFRLRPNLWDTYQLTKQRAAIARRQLEAESKVPNALQ